MPFRANVRIFLICWCLLPALATVRAGDNVDWPNTGNDKAGQRYSPLDQINRENVKGLTVAWTYNTGDADTGTTIECTPVVVDGVMYVTTVKSKVVAFEPATGKPIW